MSYQNLRKKTEGFTIIEVLIVLAIAGLIMLIVFLAVPALQRNSRNTQRKNDVSALLGAVQEAANASNGVLTSITKDEVTAASKLSTIDADKVTVTLNRTSGATVNNAADLDSVVIANYAKCADAKTSTDAGASKRSVVAMYKIETGGGTPVDQCQEM